MQWPIGQPPFQWQGGINRESAQARGLVGWWTFPPSGVTTIIHNRALSAVTLSGTLYGGLSTTVSGNGTVLNLDGSNDYVVISANALLNNPYPTLSCWFWSNNTGNNKMMLMKAHSSHANPYYILGMRHAGTNNLFMDITVNGTWNSLGPYTAPNGQWNHAALSYDGAKILCISNGVLRQTTTVSGTAATTNTPLLFGANNNLAKTSTYCFPGLLHDVRLYNRGLSEAELFRLYDPATRWELYQPPRPVTWWIPPAAASAVPRMMQAYRQRRG